MIIKWGFLSHVAGKRTPGRLKFWKISGGACPQTPLEVRAFGPQFFRVPAYSQASALLLQIKVNENRLHIAYRLMAVYNSYWVRSNVSLWRRLCAKRAFIGFWPIFILFQDRANFSQTDLFWHETHRSAIVLVDLRFFLQKKRMQKTQFSSGDLLLYSVKNSNCKNFLVKCKSNHCLFHVY